MGRTVEKTNGIGDGLNELEDKFTKYKQNALYKCIHINSSLSSCGMLKTKCVSTSKEN